MNEEKPDALISLGVVIYPSGKCEGKMAADTIPHDATIPQMPRHILMALLQAAEEYVAFLKAETEKA